MSSLVITFAAAFIAQYVVAAFVDESKSQSLDVEKSVVQPVGVPHNREVGLPKSRLPANPLTAEVIQIATFPTSFDVKLKYVLVLAAKPNVS